MASMAKVMTITPELAKEWYDNKANPQNRSISQNRVISYAQDMIDGKWQFNGEAIIFYENGMIADGHHRLLACVKAKKPFKTWVIFGISKSVDLFDKGRNRSTSDTLRMNTDIDKALTDGRVIAAIKFHFRVNGRMIPTDAQTYEFIQGNKDALLDAVYAFRRNRTKGAKTPGKASLLATFYAIKSGIDKEIIRDFFSVVKEGFYDDSSKSAAIVFRNDLILGKYGKGGEDTTSKQELYSCEKAISDFVNKVQRKMTYAGVEEPTFTMKF